MTAPANPLPVTPVEAASSPRDERADLRRDPFINVPFLGWPRTGAKPREPARAGADVRRWTINGDFLGLRATGIARYAREVTLALDGMMAEQHPLTRGLALDIVGPRQAAEPLDLRSIAVSTLPELRPRLPQVWVQLQLPGQVRDGLLSFCNLAPIRARKHIVCIHDLQTRITPESYGLLFRLMHRMILPPLAKRADIVTTVSDVSKSTMVDFGLAPPEKIAVVPNGSDHALRWDPERATRSWRRERPFILCMGRDEAHKNMTLVWRIAPRLHAIGVDVVVAGSFDSRKLDAETGGRPLNLRCVGRVSDHELARGFSEALGFVFPSRTEGFGLPAVEAMARGCPVVASRRRCLLDLCGTAALFADPDDGTEWVEAVRRLCQQPDLAAALRHEGRRRAAHYAWRAAAERYLELMLQVDQTHASRRAGRG